METYNIQSFNTNYKTAVLSWTKYMETIDDQNIRGKILGQFKNDKF